MKEFVVIDGDIFRVSTIEAVLAVGDASIMVERKWGGPRLLTFEYEEARDDALAEVTAALVGRKKS